MASLGKQLRVFMVAVALLAPLEACSRDPSTYSAEAIEAWVVDADTKAPLEGVIVTANWQLESGTLGGSVVVGQLMVMETVTDKTGRFYFPAWGPKPRGKGLLADRDPQLLLFKRGYRWRGLTNSLRKEGWRDPVRRSEWSAKTIELQMFDGSPAAYYEHIHALNMMMDFARRGRKCEWKATPRMLVELHEMKLHFESRDIRLDGWEIGRRVNSIHEVDNQEECGSAKEFFGAYLG